MFGITAKWLLGWCTGDFSKKYQQVGLTILVEVVAAEDSWSKFWKKTIAGWNSGRIGRGIFGRISAEISVGVHESILDKIFEEITNIIPEAFPRGIWDLKSMLSSHVILSESFSGACRIVYQNSLLT